MSHILQKIGEVNFSGTVKFVASENFVIDTSANAVVRISYLGKNFPAWFTYKVESNIPPSTLTYSKLTRNANDTEIIDYIGGEKKAGVSLSEMFQQITLQPNGEKGVLLNNGGVNFFYIKDTSGVLRTIRLLWQDGGWGIHAIRPLDPLNLPVWNESSQVFYRE